MVPPQDVVRVPDDCVPKRTRSTSGDIDELELLQLLDPRRPSVLTALAPETRSVCVLAVLHVLPGWSGRGVALDGDASTAHLEFVATMWLKPERDSVYARC